MRHSTTALVSAAIAVMFLISAFPMAGTISTTSAAPVTDTGYAHVAQTEEFGDTWVPTQIGTTKDVTTDWGSVSFVAPPTYLIQNIYWDGHQVGTQLYDSYVEYWYVNGSGGAATRIFSTSGAWTAKWWELNDDDTCYVIQKYGEASSLYSGSTKEFNITLRFTVFKELPIIKVDGWLRLLNASSLIGTLSFNPLMFEAVSGGQSNGNDVNRRMQYRYANDNSWATGALAMAPSPGGQGGTSCNKYFWNRSAYRLNEPLYIGVAYIYGQTITDIQATADLLQDKWYHYAPIPACTNLALVTNSTGNIDLMGYFSTDAFTYVPSDTNATIYATGRGSPHTHTFKDNPIQNYHKLPYVQWIDDLPGTETGSDPTFAWLTATAAKYDLSLTFASTFNDLTAGGAAYRLGLMAMHNGTLFEVGDHGYDHQNFYLTPFQGYAWQYANASATQSAWDVYSAEPVRSWGAPFGTWSYNTWDALGAAGQKNIRLGLLSTDGVLAMDYNLTGSPAWVTAASAQWLEAWDEPVLERYFRTLGYYQSIAHPEDADTEPEQTAVAAAWSFVQNQTGVNPMTMTAWSDEWHNRIKFYAVDGVERIDLTSCEANHRMYLSYADGTAPILWDATNDVPAPNGTWDASRGECVVVLERGTIYEVVGTFTATEDASVWLTKYNLAENPIIHLNFTASGGTVNLIFSGMDADSAYYVEVDGESFGDMEVNATGVLNITYDGPWSTHFLEVMETLSTYGMLNLLIPMFAVVIIISAMIMFVRRS